MTIHLFEAYGIEIEYMIVDRGDLRVRPIADALIRSACGRIESEIERGPLAWSNELVLHVIELKTNGPAPTLLGLDTQFQQGVRDANELLAAEDAMLLGTGMHPWMDPDREMRLWPHESSPIYEQFHRIFDCRGHGWANLQSVHVNLPFCGDDEFGRLHAAIRFVLPILPALAASSPLVGGVRTGWCDSRLEHYRRNARRVPSVSGRVIPEPVYTRAAYEGALLGGIYRDLAPLDPEGVLRHEWVNARGAIARFDRDTIEIRVLDVTECPRSDLAIVALICAAVRRLAEDRVIGQARLRAWPGEPLEALWLETVRSGDRARIADPAYLEAWGLAGDAPLCAGELWEHIAALCESELPAATREAIESVLKEGCLARRITHRLDAGTSLPELYAELARCLAESEFFPGAGAGAREGAE